MSWSKVGSTDDQTLSFVVPRLIEGTPYQFRVLAVNAEGPSEPLVSDGDITPKHPPGKTINRKKWQLIQVHPFQYLVHDTDYHVQFFKGMNYSFIRQLHLQTSSDLKVTGLTKVVLKSDI